MALTRIGRSARNLRGVSAPEALLLFVICGAILMLLAGQIEGMRTRMRKDLAARQLAVLREALLVYYLDQGDFPAGRNDLASVDAWRALRSVPPSARVLAGWPEVAEAPPAAEPVDPWRQSYRYLAGVNDLSSAAPGNGEWPTFVSSGADRRFGSFSDPLAEIDDLATDSLVLDARPSK